MQVVCDRSWLQTRHTKPNVIASEAKQSRGRQTARWIASSLALLAMTALPTRKLVAAEPAGDLIQDRVDHAGLVTIDKGVRDIDIFRYDDAAVHVLAVFEFVGTRTQYRAENGVDALQRPAVCERIVDQRIEFCLVAHHAGHDVAEECRLGGKVFVALDLASEPMTLELGEDVVEPGAGDVHLIERLHRREPRRAAPVGFLVLTLILALRWLLFLLVAALCHGQVRVSRRLIRSIASAARAASPPLLSSLGRARAQACASVLTVMMPLPSGNRFATARSISAREDTIDTISKWMVSPLITQPSAIAAS